MAASGPLTRIAEQILTQLAPLSSEESIRITQTVNRLLARMDAWEEEPDPEEWGEVWDSIVKANQEASALVTRKRIR